VLSSIGVKLFNSALTSTVSVLSLALVRMWCICPQQQGGKGCPPRLLDLGCRSTVLEAEAAIGNAMKSQSNMQVCLDVCSNGATIYFSTCFLMV